MSLIRQLFGSYSLFGGDNGGHRQAPTASSGGASDGAGAGDAGADTELDKAVRAFNAFTFTPRPWHAVPAYTGAGAGYPGAQGGMSGGISPGYSALNQLGALGLGGLYGSGRNRQLQQQQVALLQAGRCDHQDPGVYEPDPEPEDAGITVGEIIAWRAWKVKGGLLTSMYRDEHIWAPHEPITGDLKASGNSTSGLQGVHAFKSQKAALEYTDEHRRVRASHPYVAGRVVVAEFPVFVVGRVALWGEVIEHEKGYRAEYAKVQSLDVPLGVSDDEMTRLRRLYLKAPSRAARTE